ncbi:MAG: putative metal-binding motif-containing protein, partial [Deltaproteobacteria bacterium]|nr:putative metal-binding motif-containing protein [Deltaproteobacteria bacterium]
AVELTADDVANGDTAIELNWDTLPDAVYSVYKWNDATEAFELLDTGGTLAGPPFVDDGVPFAAPASNPREEIAPLPSGSLSVWTELDTGRFLGTPREGADSVVIALDPSETDGGVAPDGGAGDFVARILVAGGRTDNTAGAGSYLPTAESLGVLADGGLEPKWKDETPVFTHARAFYALVTTQDRNTTPFPDEPDEPPCSDFDGDGYIDCACAPPGTPNLDCDDSNPDIHPGATEICGDGIDQDCDQGCTGTDLPCACTDDLDNDGHISVECGGDDCCDDGTEASMGCDATTAPDIHPGAVDICDNGIDENCDGIDPACTCADDLDGDGHISIECGGDDCCDVGTDTSLGCNDTTAPGINPDEFDHCGNGIDENCDGFDPLCSPPAPPVNRVPHDLIGDEPVYVLAVYGDDALDLAGNTGRDDLEACLVDATTGRLACGAKWVVQSKNAPHATYAMDALLYYSFIFGFNGVDSETVTAGGSSRTLVSANAIHRFELLDPDVVVDNDIVSGAQSANNNFAVLRGYYPLLRLMSYIYVVGGWTDEGPTNEVERHQQ